MGKRAAIDVGTNSIRLLIALPEAVTSPLCSRRQVVRLGAHVDKHGRIGRTEWDRAVAVLRGYGKDMDRYGVRSVRAGGTAVLRRAANAGAFIRDVAERTGLTIELLSPEEEARLSLMGVLSAVAVSTETAVVFDLGGGSTEFLLCRGKDILAVISADLGALSLTERFLDGAESVDESRVDALRAYVRERVGGVVSRLMPAPAQGVGRDLTLVGTAGTVSTLAAMLQELDAYDPARVNGYGIAREALRDLVERMVSMPLQERAQLPGLEPGRADIIVAGGLMVLEVMEAFRKEEVVAADAGLLEGLLLTAR